MLFVKAVGVQRIKSSVKEAANQFHNFLDENEQNIDCALIVQSTEEHLLFLRNRLNRTDVVSPTLFKI